MGDVSRVQHVPGVSIHSMRLAEFLRPLSEKGSIVTDEQIESAVGLKVGAGQPGYGYLQTAKQIIRREKKVIWKRMRGARALKCLLDNEVVESAEHEQRSIHRKSKRVMRSLASVDTEKLDADQRRKHLTLTAQVGTLAIFSRSDTMRQLEARNCTKALSVGSVLDLMK